MNNYNAILTLPPLLYRQTKAMKIHAFIYIQLLKILRQLGKLEKKMQTLNSR